MGVIGYLKVLNYKVYISLLIASSQHSFRALKVILYSLSIDFLSSVGI
ncbi:MAG: hypothetical protein LM568_04260 [Desulfurococcaceae archaeon]|nr:hypothetical protein [Desulfurococcaceae archaeon]